jgi:hypothetical protein
MRDHRQYASNGAAKRCATCHGKLVSSDTTRGEPPFVPRNASIALELAGQVTAIGYPGSKLP